MYSIISLLSSNAAKAQLVFIKISLNYSTFGWVGERGGIKTGPSVCQKYSTGDDEKKYYN